MTTEHRIIHLVEKDCYKIAEQAKSTSAGRQNYRAERDRQPKAAKGKRSASMGAKEWISEFVRPHSSVYRFGFQEASLRHAVHLLRHQPADANAFARGTPDHRSEPMAVLGIVLLIQCHPA